MKTTTSFQNPLDNSSGIGQDNPNKAMQSASQTKKTPWHLRFAPGAILRKSGIIAVLAVVTLLATSIEQAQAADRPTPVMVTPSPPPYDVITRHLLVPAAVPPPVLLVAKPVLKRGAIQAGKWLIAVLAEWGVHTAIDKVFEDTEGQESTVTVHGAKWVSNEYEKKAYTLPSATWRTRSSWTTMADMGDEDDTSSAMGWDGPNHRSMTQHEAKGYLERRIGSITRGSWIVVETGVPRSEAAVGALFIKARSDHYQAELAKQTAIIWSVFPGATLTKASENTEKWKVGSFEMFSDFDDPAPILKALGTENAIDSEANYYEATATWEYRNLLPNGEWGEWEEAEKTFSQETGDGIKSWEDHTFSYDFCDDNQEITDPEIYEGIKRFISRRPVYERRRASGQMSRGGKFRWVRVGWEPVVAQEYQDLTSN